MAKKTVSILLMLLFATLPVMPAFGHCFGQIDPIAEAKALFPPEQSRHSAPDNCVPPWADHHSKTSCVSGLHCMAYHPCGLAAAPVHLHFVKPPFQTLYVSIPVTGILFAPGLRPPIV